VPEQESKKLTPFQIVWFKRDLRLSDHAPLVEAGKSDRPTLLLYIFEPDLLDDAHYDARHWRFVWQSLQDLNKKLEPSGRIIHYVVEDAVAVFRQLNQRYGIDRILSHEETGIAKTYQRDIQVADFCTAHQIAWKEYPTNAVVRGLMHRNDWKKRWQRRMKAPRTKPDISKITPFRLPQDVMESLRVRPLSVNVTSNNNLFQPGGVDAAQRCLYNFVHNRAAHYNDYISKPEKSRTGCSRLSPYITWGNLSLRQVYQYMCEHYEESPFKWDLHSFKLRLRWHCHFIQKFESEPRIEFENMNRGYDDIRNEVNHTIVGAWKEGCTGFPLVDACMRCVEQTGYINFRMRAMLVSFLTHNLWQDWTTGAVHLGRCFLDFEPGIHYPQFQMQAGTSGPNSVRVYNPVKQSKDHDQDGIFIKKWVPELRQIPAKQIHEPWSLSTMEQQMYGFRIGSREGKGGDYPMRLVDHKKTYKKAVDVLWGKKSEDKVKQENQRILKKHVKPRR